MEKFYIIKSCCSVRKYMEECIKKATLKKVVQEALLSLKSRNEYLGYYSQSEIKIFLENGRYVCVLNKSLETSNIWAATDWKQYCLLE